MKEDQMTVTILDDGRIRVEVHGHVSSVNHVSAEGFVKMLATLGGGETKTVKNAHAKHATVSHHSHSH